MGDDVSMKE